jgi:tRNA-dihydrouridine synthase B
MLDKFPLAINFPVCLAPMVGLSHVVLREIVQEYMPANAKTIWPSEMLSTRRLPSEKLNETPEAFHDESESFWVPQILGNDEKYITPSLKKLEDHGAHGVDINMGCPVQKVLKHNYGVALMGDSDYAARVVDMTVRNTNLPISVKLRAGLDSNEPEALLQFIKKIESAGASWITLHPRTAEQKRKGSADWSQIKWIKDRIGIPLIGNGDVQIAQDVLDLQKQTGCDSVMVGRALTARPWLMWQVGEKLGYAAPIGKTGPAPRTPEEEGREYYYFALSMHKKMHERFKPMLAEKKFLFFIRTSSAWLEFGHTLYSKVSKGKTPEEVELALHSFFESEQRMTSRTEWRV